MDKIILVVFGLLFGSFYFASPAPSFATSSIRDCVEDATHRYCYGSRDAVSGAWEERDWMVEIEALDTGVQTSVGETTDLYEEVWFLALLGDQRVLAVIDRQRYWSEFSTLVYEWTELVWIQADGTIEQREAMPFRPVEAIAFSHRLWLFDAAYVGKEVQGDGSFEPLPSRWEMTFGEALIGQTPVSLKTPEGEIVASPEIGLFRLEWTTRAGFVFSLPAVIHPRLFGLPEDGETEAPFRFTSDGVITQNGTPFESGSLVEEPGNYCFVVAGANGYRREYDVVLHPYVLGLPSTGVASSTVRVYANAAMTLNGIEYRSGTPIVKADRYDVMVFAANGYERSFSFLLAPSVVGVSDGMTVDRPLELTINGLGLLNGVPVEGSLRIEQSGEYELALMADGRVYSLVRFTVSLPEVADEIKPFEPVSLLQIGLGLLALIGLFLVLKKR